MKKILDIQDKNVKQGDIIVFENGQWITVSKAYYLGELYNKNVILENEIKELQKQIEKLNKDVAKLASILKGVI